MKFLTWATLVCCPVLAGCGSADGLNRGGTLSGKVLLDGKPIGGGTVEIFSADGTHTVSCEIKPDGSYVIEEPPLGNCKLMVATSQLRGMPRPPAKKPGTKGDINSSPGMTFPDDVGLVYTPIPGKYEDKETSGLTVNVTEDHQKHDIKLTKK